LNDKDDFGDDGRNAPALRTDMRHRPDIDGLRAIAVLAVVAYHAFPGGVRGGFSGVDVFFVISGFLISSLIVNRLERGDFTFRDFYLRRLRRLSPSLAVVLAAVFIFGWFALLGDEFMGLGRHLAGGAGFMANFLYWRESGYFDPGLETKPLMHLWSLGVEEQFYLLFPPLLVLAWRRGLALFAGTAVLLLVSFGFNLAWSLSDPTADFYSPLTRFWELLSGVLLALASRAGAPAKGQTGGPGQPPVRVKPRSGGGGGWPPPWAWVSSSGASSSSGLPAPIPAIGLFGRRPARSWFWPPGPKPG
jgi:peptidoglycan/LPS O-acetylase OafA/YrhL